MRARLDQLVEHAVQLFGMLISELSRIRLVRTAAALNGVDADGPGRASKADQRNARIKRRLYPLHGFANGGELGEQLFHGHAGKILRLRRRIDAGPLPFEKADIPAHGVEHEQDVGEQDRAIHAVASHWLERRFGGEGRGIAEIEEVARTGSHLPVLGKVTPSLTHHPYRNGIDAFTVQHSEQGLPVHTSPGGQEKRESRF